MRVVFLLPTSGKKPVGGYKVVYEYANALADRGHAVTILHAQQFRAHSGRLSAKDYLKYLAKRIGQSYRPDTWFKLRDDVEVKWVPSLHQRYAPAADVVVATSWETAEWAATYGDNKGRKFYLIQHLEDWSGPRDRVLATWKLPFQKIVISKWLLETARDLGEEATYIPNGLNFSAFGLDTAIEARKPDSVVMLFHTLPWKGSADGIEALRRARDSVPSLTATLFGVPSAPTDLPEWIAYHQLPPQRELRRLYNEAAIFLSPSWAEGWPLPPAEAMMCGCAPILTDIGGHREYGFHGRTALMCLPKSPISMAEAITRLCYDAVTRHRIAREANTNVQQFTWARAVDSLLQTMRGEAPAHASSH